MSLLRSLLLVLILISLECHAIGKVVTRQGSYQIAAKFSIASKILNEDRTFFVSLPASYDKSNSTYPVLLLLDGAQNLEHSVASARMLSQWKGIPETIIVAVPSKNRVKDFTPTKDVNYSKDSGGAANFAEFLEKEVMGFIDKQYRTHPYRILAGHSLAGLFATSQLLSQSNFFSAYIIIAPALWWDSYYTINKLKKSWQAYENHNKPIYFSIGEFDGFGMKQDMEQVYEILLANKTSQEQYAHHEYEGEGHMSVTLQSIYDGLQHVFKRTIYQESLWPKFSSESFIEFNKKSKELYGSSVTQTGELFIKLSQYLIDKKDFVGAITVLKTNIDSYPKYPFNYEELANAYALNDQPQLAIDAYKKAAMYAREHISFGDGVAKKYQAAIEILEHPIIHEAATLKQLIGCYVSESGSTFKFTIDQGNLIGSREDWVDFRLFADRQSSFFTRTQPRLVFEFKKQAVIISIYGNTHIYKKGSCQ